MKISSTGSSFTEYSTAASAGKPFRREGGRNDFNKIPRMEASPSTTSVVSRIDKANDSAPFKKPANFTVNENATIVNFKKYFYDSEITTSNNFPDKKVSVVCQEFTDWFNLSAEKEGKFRSLHNAA